MNGLSRARSARLSWFSCVLILALALALAACSEDSGPGTTKNEPPSVWLVSAPPEGDSTSYRVDLEWGGSDPDGHIVYYEYAITDNKSGSFAPRDTIGPEVWHKVYGEESLFVFSADELTDPMTEDPVARFQRSHTFFIRAVDNRGARSPEPAYRSFTAWTLSPEAQVVLPRYVGATPALMPNIATYVFRATDYINSKVDVQDPDSIRWILHPVEGTDFPGAIDFVRENLDSDEWYPWTDYNAPDGAGKSWTTPPTPDGLYVFAVQAKDEAGAVTPVFDERRNVRRIRVATVDSGPLLSVFNEYTGVIITSVPNTPAVIVDLPAGLPISFKWRASADAYGGVVAGYRYGWDVVDLDDPNQWEIDYTPFVSNLAASTPRTFYFGSHTFNVEVIDNGGRTSRVEVKINFIPFSMTKNLLLVDDFNLPSAGIGATNGALPSDAEHDAFWQSMLDGVAGFSIPDDAIQVSNSSELSISMIADYKNIVWDAYASYDITQSLRPKLYDLIHFRRESGIGAVGKVQPNLLALFMRVGGHLMLCGRQPMTQSIDRSGSVLFPSGPKFPFVFKFELEGDQDGRYVDQIQSEEFVGDLSFPYKDACLNVLDIAYPNPSALRTDAENDCGVDKIHGTVPRTNGLREALPIATGFPLLQLRSEVAAIGKYYAPDQRGLDAELYNPHYFAFCPFAEISRLRDCFQPVYGHGCLDTESPLYNAPVAFWSAAYADVVPNNGVAARSFFMGVEPYYFEPAQVKAMMESVLFDEWGLPRI